MSRPEPVLDRSRLNEALITMLDHALPTCAHIEYRLVGTGAALAIHRNLPGGGYSDQFHLCRIPVRAPEQ
jgi:hypothetical protein